MAPMPIIPTVIRSEADLERAAGIDSGVKSIPAPATAVPWRN